MNDLDFDWIVVGSGFGGSVAALRLGEKGYRVAVIERGRRYEDADLPTSAGDRRRFVWLPALGLRGIMRNVLFEHVFSSTQTGVGGGSLVYGGVLFRPQRDFFDNTQWKQLAPWEQVLDRHYSTAEKMLGASTTPWESEGMRLSRELAAELGTSTGFAPAPVAVFFGEPGKTVSDPYFGGEGPDRTGCTRCGDCMIGCRVGASNRLTKNYLWFAERKGVQILPDRSVVDIAPLRAADGRDGYTITFSGPGGRQTLTARGVVLGAGAVGTNELLATCKHGGSLPRISDRLGHLVRTNSEAVLSVLFPEDRGTWKDVAASSRVLLDPRTQVELLTYGRHADFMRLMFTVLVGDGSRSQRLGAWLLAVLRRPGRWFATTRRGWSRRSAMLLVMQAEDNAIRFRARRRRFGRGYRLVTDADPERPAPTYLEVGHRAATWLAQRTGGIAQSSVFEALGNRPMTAHVLGGAVIGSDAATGVVDDRLRVFGYENLLVCDAAALPANPGVNPALTITALAEYAMSHVPARSA